MRTRSFETVPTGRGFVEWLAEMSRRRGFVKWLAAGAAGTPAAHKYLGNQRRQGGEIGRRARLRIPKSSISKQRFSFQNAIVLRGENVFLLESRSDREW